MYLIYMHKNKINGKSYIGKTSCVSNPNKRWKNGLGYMRGTQPAFYNALQKYGWDNFEHIILENYIESASKACAREKYYIKKYHTWVQDPECWGYNCTIGGDGASGHKLSNETKQKLRKARLAQKNLNTAANKGRKYYNNGKVCIMCFPGTEPEGFVIGRLLSKTARNNISKAMTKNNKNRKGNLNKTCIYKNGMLKCIGTVNLEKYLADGWVVHIAGDGGKWGGKKVNGK